MDNGTVPALIDEIRSELDISKDIVGLFGSLQYGGNLIGNNKLIYKIKFKKPNLELNARNSRIQLQQTLTKQLQRKGRYKDKRASPQPPNINRSKLN